MSEDTVFRRCKSGEWTREAQGVYRATDHRKSHSTRLWVAFLSAGEDATAHGRSAAWWHGLTDLAPGRHSITVPTRRTIRRVNVDLRRRDLKPADISTVRGLSVTGVPLTILELQDSVVMDQALQTRTTIARLKDAYARNAHARGWTAVGCLLKSAESGGRSEAERRLHHVIATVDGWRPQVEALGYYFDAAFEDLKIGIEVDGWRWHKDAQRHSRDLARQNTLLNAGWHVLRFDWHRLTNAPDDVRAEVIAAVARRSKQVG